MPLLRPCAVYYAAIERRATRAIYLMLPPIDTSRRRHAILIFRLLALFQPIFRLLFATLDCCLRHHDVAFSMPAAAMMSPPPLPPESRLR